jgi:asparagine synthase (glutamine-hydrolysing)
MCGIAGFFDYAAPAERREGAVRVDPAARHESLARTDPAARAENLARLGRMVAALRHRGPDDAGYHLAGPFALGHARLSIIDVAGGHQPLFSEDRAVAAICNGEIYNHRELRAGLERRGHRFATRSDTEVAVHLYEELGEGCVERLEGMFALAIADARNRRLLLARDRLGKKPLYLADDGRQLAFASELKGLLAGGWVAPEIDPEALDLYLALGYVPAPWSIFAGARKLPAAHYAVCDRRGLRVRRYWDVEFAPEEHPEERWVDELEEALARAVGERLESDVPLGAFLSGGIDSGTVVALMSEAMSAPVLTHTVGFDDAATDEREDAAAVAGALGADHRSSLVRPDLAAILPRVARHFDEPFADPSAVPTWYVSRETRRRVTVALSGDGGDELFAGYPGRYGQHLLEERLRPWLPGAVRRHLFPALARRWPRSPRLPRPLRLGGALANLAADADRAYWRDRQQVPEHLAGRLFGPALAERRRRFDPFAALAPHLARAPRGDALARSLYLDLKTWLADDGLVKVDRMSMAHALEVRCPLLDRRVVELAFRMPSRIKLRAGETKRPLRRLAERRLPPAILARPKRGFAPPVDRWLRGELAGFARDLLLAPGARAAELCAPGALARLLDDHAARRLDAGWAIWSLLMLEVWSREVERGWAAGRADAEPEVARAAV